MVAEKELALNRSRDAFSGLAVTGQAERAYLVEPLIWLSEPQMSVPRPDLPPHPSAHLPLVVSSHVPQSTLVCSHLCTPFYPLLSSAIQPLLPFPTSLSPSSREPSQITSAHGALSAAELVEP